MSVEHDVFVGQGLTLRSGSQLYPCSIVEVSEDGSRFWFKQDIPVRKKGVYFGPAYVFKPAAPERMRFGAHWDGDHWVSEFSRLSEVELGVRRCFTTPVVPPSAHPALGADDAHEGTARDRSGPPAPVIAMATYRLARRAADALAGLMHEPAWLVAIRPQVRQDGSVIVVAEVQPGGYRFASAFPRSVDGVLVRVQAAACGRSK